METYHLEFSRHAAKNTGKPATLLVQSVKTKNKRSASYQETDGFVLDGSLYILDLPLFFFFLTFKLPNSRQHQCHPCGCCQPFFCSWSSCNKQDTVLGQCSQEADSYPLVPEEFIRGTVAQVLSLWPRCASHAQKWRKRTMWLEFWARFQTIPRH